MNSLRVGIYLRLSNEDKDKLNKNDESESIKNQRNMLIDYIQENSDFFLVDEYCDEDLSGAGAYRPEFERLLKDCENRKLDIVLCKSQSRFSRDIEIVEKYINNKFKEWNIRFISLSDNADTNNLGNKKARQINGLVNEWYLEDVSDNIRSAFYSKMKQGELISPFAPFGYEISKTNNNKLVIDPIASGIVKEIYNLYILGLGLTSIANYLNKKNIPSPSLYKYLNNVKLNVVSNTPRKEIKWNSNTIKNILTNEVYIGNLIQGKRTTISYKNHKIRSKNKSEWIRVNNTHEPIIDKELFYNVQKKRRERTRPIKSTGTVHTFSKKVFCLECQKYMRKKNSSKHEYLVCSSNNICNNYCINKNGIRYDELEKIILNEINKIINRFFKKEELNLLEYNGKYSNVITSLKNKKGYIENKIIRSKDYLKKIYEDKTNGIVSIEQFKTLSNYYEKENTLYQEQLLSMDKEISYYESKKELVINKYTPLKQLNNVILDEFISKIYIGKHNKENRIIKIIWNL